MNPLACEWSYEKGSAQALWVYEFEGLGWADWVEKARTCNFIALKNEKIIKSSMTNSSFVSNTSKKFSVISMYFV